MKNFFLIINKEKIYAYTVSVLTIVTLFFMSHVLKSEDEIAQETSANIEITNSYSQNVVIENKNKNSNMN